MTDTIGWGDVDVEPQRQRRWRRLTWVAAPIAVVVVVALALAPTVKSDLARSSMRWLQRQWALQAAYDDARETTLSAAATRVGIADTPAFVRLVQEVDARERAHLLAIARAVTGHHTWSADVARARDAIRRTLRAEAADLEHESASVGRVERSVVQVFTPTPFTASTAAQVESTDAVVLKAAAAHHLDQVGRPSVHLDGGGPILRLLSRVTDQPLPLRLVVADPGGYVLWDLRTGGHRVLAPTETPSTPVMPVIGARLLVQTDTSYELVPLDGSPPLRLPGNDVYLPDGRGGLWRVRNLVAQRLDASLRPVGPGRHIPAGYGVESGYNEPAETDLLVVTKFTPTRQDPAGAVLTTFLWRPDDGRLLRMPSDCGAVTAVSGLAVAESCGTDSSLVTLDAQTGRRRVVRPPTGESFAGWAPVLSADGRHAAVVTSARGDPDATATGVAVIDLATAHVTRVTDDPRVRPLTWSPDGRILIVAQTADTYDCCADSGTSAYGYWYAGMHGLASIRITTLNSTPPIAVVG